jgi:hypothetical protein
MKTFVITFFFLLILLDVSAQIDTINTTNIKLNLSAWRDASASYAVYLTDSTGKRLSSADIWDRSLRRVRIGGKTHYEFSWKWYHNDSLLAHVRATGEWPSLTPLTHQASYARRGQRSFVFANNVVTIPDSARRTTQDSLFRVRLQPAAFEFPMDLEVLPLLPFRQVGQQFAVAFYEPGSASSAYYRLRVKDRQELVLAGQAKLACWVLRIDYRPDSYATLWISEQSRQVVKMQEYYRGRYRYKVRLY